MKYIKPSETKKFITPTCVVTEYPFGDKDINGAIGELHGRYPEKGRVTNTQCKELVYIIKGNGKIEIEGKEVILNEGDMVVIEPNEKYYWEGHMTFMMPCTPAWYPEQHVEVE